MTATVYYPMDGDIHITLPRVPSINRLWRIGHGRMYRSSEYVAWLAECVLLIRQQRIAKVKGHYQLSIRAVRPDKRRRDIDNIGGKAINDLLQHAGIVEDDCLCDLITCQWVTTGPPTSVTVTPIKE
jgi:Holliday junction resolvase RusA-like endonuclease